MPRFRVVLDPRAESDARHAFLWYAERSAVAASDFELLLTQAIEDLGDSALSWPVKGAGLRVRLVEKYPYALMYRVRGEEVLIVAVAHQRRRPGYWRPRT